MPLLKVTLINETKETILYGRKPNNSSMEDVIIIGPQNKNHFEVSIFSLYSVNTMIATMSVSETPYEFLPSAYSNLEFEFPETLLNLERSAS